MVEGLTLSVQVYVIDTSYLVELFAVPGHSSPGSIEAIRKKHEVAIKNEGRLYVPFPCIIELGNHIASVADGRKRRQLANILRDTVISSVDSFSPWTITPACTIDLLPQTTDEWLAKFVDINVGLTDSFVVQEAERIKAKYESFGYEIHIWTRDVNLKAYEPDKEKNPFV
jgi:hypothetical protein